MREYRAMTRQQLEEDIINYYFGSPLLHAAPTSPQRTQNTQQHTLQRHYLLKPLAYTLSEANKKKVCHHSLDIHAV